MNSPRDVALSILAEAITDVRPKLENDWNGGAILKRLEQAGEELYLELGRARWNGNGHHTSNGNGGQP